MDSPPPPPPAGYMPPPPGYAPIQAAGGTTYAGFWIRVVARLVDVLILGIPFGILFGVFAAAGSLFASTSNASNQSGQGAAAALFGGVFVLFYLFALAVTFGYWIYFWGSSGETIGMRLLRLRVIDANTGAPIGYARATIRLLMTFVNTWACYIGWIWVAFDARKQGWHDKVANSVVVHH